MARIWGFSETPWMSNFFPAEVWMDGEEYPDVETAFATAKTVDPAERAVVRATRSPGAAKRAGRRVTLRPDWNEVRVEVMRALIEEKFAVGSALASLLLETAPAEIYEANTWGDRFWGVDAVTGEGATWLGRLLMLRRDELEAYEESWKTTEWGA